MPDTTHSILHVKDAYFFDLPHFLGGQMPIPQPFVSKDLIFDHHHHIWVPPPDGTGFYISKFMVLELIAAVMICAIFIPLAGAISRGGRPKGKLWNFFEAMLVFFRDTVARPAIGHHDADKYLPFLWTIFFFVLFNNLLGMLPWLGSPTGSIAVTGALAAVTFITVVGTGVFKFGLTGFLESLVPHMELPKVLAIFLLPMMFVIELGGLLIKHFVLSVRLLANMFAGHLVLAVIMGFIAETAQWHVAGWASVAGVSVLGAVALSLLELFVAFLQAYIFTFLSALFIGMVAHPH